MTVKGSSTALRVAQELIGTVKKEVDLTRKSSIERRLDIQSKVIEDKFEALHQIIAVLTVMQIISTCLLLSQIF